MFELPWRDFRKKVLLVWALCIATLMLVAVAIRWLAGKDSDIEIKTGANSAVRIAVRTAGGTDNFLMVPANGPIDTGIDLEDGDSLEFNASGKINLSAFRLLKSVELRHAIEDSISGRACTKAGESKPVRSCRGDSLSLEFFRKHSADTASVSPDQFFSARDFSVLSPRYEWMGPDGNGVEDRSWAARKQRKAMQDMPYGALLGARAAPGQSDTTWMADSVSRATMFPIGRSGGYLYCSNADGRTPSGGQQRRRLWLLVNDIWSAHGTGGGVRDPLPERFYMDNLGSFLVRVSVRHRSKFTMFDRRCPE